VLLLAPNRSTRLNCPARHRRPTNRLRRLSRSLFHRTIRGTGLGAKKRHLCGRSFRRMSSYRSLKSKTQATAATASSTQRKCDIRLRYYVTGPVSAEFRFINENGSGVRSPVRRRRDARRAHGVRCWVLASHVVEMRLVLRIEVFWLGSTSRWAYSSGWGSRSTRCAAECSRRGDYGLPALLAPDGRRQRRAARADQQRFGRVRNRVCVLRNAPAANSKTRDLRLKRRPTLLSSELLAPAKRTSNVE